MKKFMKRIICGALVGALTLSLAACGQTESSDSDKLSTGSSSSSNSDGTTVGIVVKVATNAHFHDIAYGACVAAKELGIDIMVDNTTSETDTEGQITLVENMISAGADAVIVTPNDSEGMTTAVEDAYAAGVPFVTADTTITNVWGDQKTDYIPNFVGADNTEITYHLALKVFEEMGGKGNVVILRGIDATSSSSERTAGFEQAAAEYPDITIIESQSANYSQDDAVSTMSDICQRYNDIDAVLCCNDMMAVGACSALMENGYEVGVDGVLVAGVDGNIVALESIERGEMYATSYDWAILWGYLSVYQAYDLIQGKEVPEYTLTQTDCVITAENLADYMPHSLEVQDWGFSGKIPSEVSDFMNNFIQTGIEGVTYQ